MKILANLLVLVLVLSATHGQARAQATDPLGSTPDAHPEPFIHPGALHSLVGLNRMRDNVKAGVEPWKSAWEAFQQCPFLDKSYTPHPLSSAGRDKKNHVGQKELADDMSAAYYNAIAWYISGDESYARKSIEIMNGWSHTNTEIIGSDAVLAAGIYGYKVANAAEIIRSTYKGWAPEDVEQMKKWLREVWFPVIKDLGDANWGTCCMPTIVSIGVFCDDHAIFTFGINAYKDGGIGKNLCGVDQYISETGQCGESGRDQPHAQGGLGHLAETAEIAWNQGIDLYGYSDNRLLQGFEYTAKYNLGFDVPYAPAFHRGTMGPWGKISDKGRGLLSPVYEMVWNHYLNRKGLPAPFTHGAALKYAPEKWSVDHPGIGALTFTLKLSSETPAPVLSQDLSPLTTEAVTDQRANSETK